MTAANRLQGRAKPAPLRLVKKTPSVDTIKALETLLELARRGEVTGIAFACALPGMRYVTDITGTLYDHPTFGRGAISFLGDQLAGLVHARDASEIR